MRIVSIDPASGFCGGVIRAIKTAEDYLASHGGTLLSLGEVVHNEEELARLESLGLVTINKDALGKQSGVSPLMIRAHGEPPQMYSILSEYGYQIIDCTCPVVLKLQKSIREASAKGRIVIFGKKGHPEVLGLVGQVDGGAVVVEGISEMQEAVLAGKVDLGSPVQLFSQTTMSPEGYAELAAFLRERCSGDLEIHETICQQVAHRHRDLTEFASSHDVVIFVSGRHSSNGKVLCDLCRSVNERTYMVSRVEELDPAWFQPSDKVGVSGATSTPKWLLEQIARTIEKI
ncbi:MAG: 4-hydroxy-3-methylbut-2-enyl diphosphate reductase [Bacteroidales bacterium]|nr:4-hydroxy-3-methylbut-2-enyl diphosphate reductase [Candidatus Cryptobacteroides equifaecalis]